MTPSEVLDKAADYIQEHGHFQGTFYDGGSTEVFPPCCVEGAIAAVLRPGLWRVDRDECVERAYGIDSSDEAVNAEEPIIKIIRDSVAQWNDDPERTKQEVIDTLRAAARAAE